MLMIYHIASHYIPIFFQVYPIIMLLSPRKVLVDACRSPAMADFPIFSLMVGFKGKSHQMQV